MRIRDVLSQIEDIVNHVEWKDDEGNEDMSGERILDLVKEAEKAIDEIESANDDILKLTEKIRPNV